MNLMATPKRKKVSGKHQSPRRLVGLPEDFGNACEKHAEERLMTLTELVRQVMVRYATSEGFWPPKDAPGTK